MAKVVAAALTITAGALVVGGWLLLDAVVLSRGDAATEELPPSERGLTPSTTLPATTTTSTPPNGGGAVPEPNAVLPESVGERFTELVCEFEGTSTLEPSLTIGLPFGGGRHRMGLEPGAQFECQDGTQRSSGVIQLDATFESLNAFNGATAGTGSIRWTSGAPDALAVGEDEPVSATAVEIQLDYPVIVVWTTILDGPYAGFRGRLVLRDWEQRFDSAGDVEGIRFARTSTTFAPT